MVRSLPENIATICTSSICWLRAKVGEISSEYLSVFLNLPTTKDDLCPRCRSQPQYPWQPANCSPVPAKTGAILRHIPITHRGEEAGRAVNHQAYGAA